MLVLVGCPPFSTSPAYMYIQNPTADTLQIFVVDEYIDKYYLGFAKPNDISEFDWSWWQSEVEIRTLYGDIVYEGELIDNARYGKEYTFVVPSLKKLSVWNLTREKVIILINQNPIDTISAKFGLNIVSFVEGNDNYNYILEAFSTGGELIYSQEFHGSDIEEPEWEIKIPDTDERPIKFYIDNLTSEELDIFINGENVVKVPAESEQNLVEIYSEGLLNWFEFGTSARVGHVEYLIEARNAEGELSHSIQFPAYYMIEDDWTWVIPLHTSKIRVYNHLNDDVELYLDGHFIGTIQPDTKKYFLGFREKLTETKYEKPNWFVAEAKDSSGQRVYYKELYGLLTDIRVEIWP